MTKLVYFMLNPLLYLMIGMAMSYGVWVMKLKQGALTHHHVQCLLRDPEDLVPQPQLKDILKVIAENKAKNKCPVSVMTTALMFAHNKKREGQQEKKN